MTGARVDLSHLVTYLEPESRQFWVDRLQEAEDLPPSSFRANGYVVTALQAAWCAISQTPEPTHAPSAGTFASQQVIDTLETAIRIGHDTDTVASIAGALLGARWGATAFGAQWRRRVHGWPGARVGDLVNLALLSVNAGQPDHHGWPGTPRMDYHHWEGHDALVVHPHDPQVYLSGASALDHLPDDVTAVVSLCRLGSDQIPAHLRGSSVEFRILDTNAADNPNLEYAIDDAARTVAELRAEGKTVLLHCVAAHSRTPTVAARYSMLLGHSMAASLDAVCRALPAANPNPALVAALRRLEALSDPDPGS
jgi:protein-tyrosine phosphatase